MAFLFGEGDVGRCDAVALIVRDDLHTAILVDAHTGVGGSKIDSESGSSTSHVCCRNLIERGKKLCRVFKKVTNFGYNCVPQRRSIVYRHIHLVESRDQIETAKNSRQELI